MPNHAFKVLALLALEAWNVCGLAIPQPQPQAPNPNMTAMTGDTSRSAYPFNQLVAFGDQLSDNGSGSFAHGLDDKNIYGHHTWTDGPVAVQYLAQQLGVSLLDFAWGGANGGGLAGATVDNSYTPAKDTYQGRPVPSTKDQIYGNYLAHGKPQNIAHALQVLWIGQNDIKKHTTWYANPVSRDTPDNPTNVAFYRDFTARLVPQVEHLIQMGAPAVVVPNIFPIHLAPETQRFFCHGNQQCATNWGKVVQTANAHIKASLAASRYASKIIYYDVYGFMMKIMANKNAYGFTEPLNFLCDGDANGNTLPTEKWDQCRANKPSWSAARPFFWFSNGNPETHVHQFIAGDMKRVIDAHFQGGGW